MKLDINENDSCKIYIQDNSLVVKFKDRYNSVSSGFLNAAYLDETSAIFNHKLNKETSYNLEIQDVEDYLIDQCNSLDLDYKSSTGLITTAKIENYGISTLKYRNLEVTSIVTAGVRVNATRAGDKASYYEENNEFDFEVGTINILVLVNGSLNKNILTNALIVATEAKTAILNDLRVPSIYGEGFATGTGTDGVIIASNKSNGIPFNNAGTHSMLGQLIAQTVKIATEQSLLKEMYITRTSQCDVIVRLNKLKFDINEFYDFSEYDKFTFISDLKKDKKNILNVAITSSVLNLIEEAHNDLITKEVAYALSCEIIKNSPSYTVKELLKFVCFKYLMDNKIK